MAINSGHPHCTEWKNHQYKQTKAIEDIDYTVLSAVAPFDTAKPTIYMNDMHTLDADCADITYQIQITGGLGSNIDSIGRIQRAYYWVEGKKGTSNISGSTISFFLTDGAYDHGQTISLNPFESYTVDWKGQNPISLFTMQPGLMLGLGHKDYADDDDYTSSSLFSFKLKNPKANCLHPKNKLMTNTHTCWIKFPSVVGDSVVTDVLPSNINNLGFTMFWNIARHIPKRSAGVDLGVYITVEGSVDKTNWSEITNLATDPDVSMYANTDNFALAMHFDTHELGGGDFPYKRIKIKNPFAIEAGGTSPATACISQWIQIGVIPAN